MTAISPFQFDGRPVRVATDDNGEPLFVGKDVCDALGYADATTAIKSHCRGVQKLHPIADALGRMQETRVLAEPDVLRLIVNCTLPAAQAFERLVFEEILPTIRRTGTYTAPARAKRSNNSGLDAFRQARALQIATSVAGGICDRFPGLGKPAQQVIFAKLVNPVAGSDVVPLPMLESRLYSAEDAGKKLGVSANMIGRTANQHSLKTTEFGMFVLDKSRSSDKQVEAFRYNDAGLARLRELLRSGSHLAQVPATQAPLI